MTQIELNQTPETFAQLGVHPDIIKALKSVNITSPFPIQALALPIALSGTDMIGQARTGTGKTLAFGIAALQRINVAGDPEFDPELKAPQALIMCPTRELALQVADDLTTASTFRAARVLTVYGGVGYDIQLDALEKGVDVVVGTPGRLLDLANRKSLDLSKIKILVLDEAEEMLDMGFLPDVESLVGKTPHSRQTLLFSATMPAAIVALARSQLNQPMNVRAETHDAQLTVPDTTQFVYRTHDLDKPAMIGKILQAPDRGRTIIFTHTKRQAQRLADDLADRGFKVRTIHGDLGQAARERSLEKFRDESSIDVLVATDVAARGIDVTDVTHVINYECPDNEMTYVHRIGRTGRAGKDGIAVTFVDWADETRWKVISKTLKLPFEEPAEVYSTSPEFLADLKIPEGAKAYLRDPEEARAARLEREGAKDDRGGRSRGRSENRGRGERHGNAGRRNHDGQRSDAPAKAGSDDASASSRPRKRNDRPRKRLRNGRPVAENGE
ncbi:MAG: DEAD/DEAH box helicase [Propionibacteriaceae bacterium]|jgi:superfamily II DNA/RNA helicase|nr:DEAD/DEAH box helicase [Propionibacteriaceae bacterium]